MTRGGGILNFVTSHLKNDVDTVNVSDINCPNENDGTTMPAINDIKSEFEVRGLKMFNISFFLMLMFCSFSYLCLI